MTAAGGTTTAALATAKGATKAAQFRNAYYVTDGQAFAVRIDKAVYQVAGYAIDAQNYYYCRPTEKFLKLTMRVKNVSDQPQPFDYQTVTVGGMTADGEPLSPTKNWKALDDNKLANRTLAPNAEMEIEGVITVPADGDPRTLSFGDDSYDLTEAANRIDPLPAPLGGGNSAPVEAPAVADGTYYSLAFTDGAVTGIAQLPGGLGISLKVRNATAAPIKVTPQNYTMELYDEDGDKYTVTAATNAVAAVALNPGQETTLHFTFDVPKTIRLQSLKARERDGRIYAFPIGAK